MNSVPFFHLADRSASHLNSIVWAIVVGFGCVKDIRDVANDTEIAGVILA